MNQYSKEDVLRSLDKVKPYLNSDGGDIEFVGLEEDVVKIRLIGSCSECPHKFQTLAGIQEVILKDLPNIKEVKVIDERN